MEAGPPQPRADDGLDPHHQLEFPKILQKPLQMTTAIIVGGPAGTGKSTVASILAERYGCPFVEGDVLHPAENVAKMAKGIPLTDDDRWGWLEQLSKTVSEKARTSESGVAIASCSMLKKVYREYLKKAAGDGVSFRFVFLYTTYEENLLRVASRKGHFMKLDMVKSQYDIMEVPEGDELLANGGEAVSVDTTNRSPDEIGELLVNELRL